MNIIRASFLTVAPLLCSPALAQLDIPWYTIDAGGGASSGGGLTVIGTVGQPDAGASAGGGLTIACGFWPGGAAACYANCDASTIAPILNVNDFSCFLNKYAAGDLSANCDGSTIAPILNVNDFSCFLNRYAIGCP
jgi:hypothetical protein